jgi:four helix bundle protein
MNKEVSITLKEKIQSFKDLLTWQEGHKLVLIIYKLTNKFPAEERFGLTNQLRRAAVSVTSHIAEGFSRRTMKDKAQFYHMGLGSLTETENQSLVARDLEYFSDKEYISSQDQIVLVSKLLNGLIKATRSYNLIHDS